MIKSAAWAMPTVEVFRPVEELDSLWWESLANRAERNGIGDIRWYPASDLRTTLLSGVELRGLALSKGVVLREGDADSLSVAISDALPPSADDAVPIALNWFAQRSYFPDVRPSTACLTVAGMHPAVTLERAAVKRVVGRMLGVADDHELWAPSQSCEVHVADGSSKSIAALRAFMASQVLFMPRELTLGRAVVDGM